MIKQVVNLSRYQFEILTYICDNPNCYIFYIARAKKVYCASTGAKRFSHILKAIDTLLNKNLIVKHAAVSVCGDKTFVYESLININDFKFKFHGLPGL